MQATSAGQQIILAPNINVGSLALSAELPLYR
jgi:hypothetical protein